MKAIVQRVSGTTSIQIGPSLKSFTGPGLVVLLGWDQGDAQDEVSLGQREDWIVSRVQGLRVFPDAQEKMNLSLSDYLAGQNQSGGILWVSQFTLAAKLNSGFRPSFTEALLPDLARARYDALVEKIKRTQQAPAMVHLFGEFGADMSLTFTNWGPVTICL